MKATERSCEGVYTPTSPCAHEEKQCSGRRGWSPTHTHTLSPRGPGKRAEEMRCCAATMARHARAHPRARGHIPHPSLPPKASARKPLARQVPGRGCMRTCQLGGGGTRAVPVPRHTPGRGQGRSTPPRAAPTASRPPEPCGSPGHTFLDTAKHGAAKARGCAQWARRGGTPLPYYQGPGQPPSMQSVAQARLARQQGECPPHRKRVQTDAAAGKRQGHASRVHALRSVATGPTSGCRAACEVWMTDQGRRACTA